MHLQVLIGLVLALACAAGASLGGLWKQKGALQASDVDVRHPVNTAAALFRSKWFVIGWLVAALAWLMHVGALALAPLSLAQAVIAGGLVLLGVIAERFFGFRLHRRQWLGLIVLAFGMAVLAVTAHSDRNHSSYAIIAISAFQGAAVGLGVLCVASCRVASLRDQHGLLLGIAAGFLFGVSDISIKAATSGTHGLVGVVGPWSSIGVFSGVAAFYASARSFQVGDGVAVIAATASAANLLGIIGGIVVFGDSLGNGALTIGGRLLAFILVVFSVGLIPAPMRAHEAASTSATDSVGQSPR